MEFLQLDGWRSLKMEQNRSEKKGKTVGEKGMADRLFIRYSPGNPAKRGTLDAAWVQVLWVEFKRLTKSGKPTKASPHQIKWHREERDRGALTWIAGSDFPASIEGFIDHYKASGLARRVAA